MTMTELNPKKALFELSVDVQVLCSELRKVKPGSDITYERLNDLIKGDVQKTRRPTLTSALRILQRESLVFATVRKYGLKRIVSDDIIDAAKAPMNRIRTQVRKGVKLLACVEYNELSNDAKVQMNATSSLYGALDQATRPKAVKALNDSVAQNSRPLSFGETIALFNK